MRLPLYSRNLSAGVVKLVDALDSKSSGATRVGSIPTFGTNVCMKP